LVNQIFLFLFNFLASSRVGHVLQRFTIADRLLLVVFYSRRPLCSAMLEVLADQRHASQSKATTAQVKMGCDGIAAGYKDGCKIDPPVSATPGCNLLSALRACSCPNFF